jgi:hypothetical protein
MNAILVGCCVGTGFISLWVKVPALKRVAEAQRLASVSQARRRRFLPGKLEFFRVRPRERFHEDNAFAAPLPKHRRCREDPVGVVAVDQMSWRAAPTYDGVEVQPAQA